MPSEKEKPRAKASKDTLTMGYATSVANQDTTPETARAKSSALVAKERGT